MAWHTAILVSEVERSALVVRSTGDIAHVDELSAAAVGEDAEERSAGAKLAGLKTRFAKRDRGVEKSQCGAGTARSEDQRKGNAGSAGLRVGQQQRRPSSGVAAKVSDTATEGA